jgi:hypothetical protein
MGKALPRHRIGSQGTYQGGELEKSKQQRSNCKKSMEDGVILKEQMEGGAAVEG